MRLLPASRLVAFLAALLSAGPAAALVPGDLVAVVDGPGAPQVLALPFATGVPEVIASGGLLVAPRDVASLPRTGKLLVVDRDAGPGGTGAVIEIDPAAYDAAQPGANQRLVAGGGLLVDPESIAVLKGGATAVVGDPTAGAVIQVTTRGGQQAALGSFSAVTGVAADLDDRVYAVSPAGAPEVRRWNPLGAQWDLISAGGFFGTPARLAFEPVGTLLVSDAGLGVGPNGRVIRVDPSIVDTGNPGANQSLLSDGGSLVDPTDVAIDRAGGLYASDVGAESGAGAVYRVDRLSGATTLFAPLGAVVGIDVFRLGARRGDIAVADAGSDANVVLVDRVTGAQRLVLSLAIGFPVDVEWEPDGDLLVLASGGGGAPRVLRVDPATGLHATIAVGGGTGTNDFNVAERMQREGDTLWIGDSATFVSPTFETGAIFALDLPSLMRTLFTGGGPKFRVLSLGVVPTDGDFVVGTTDGGFGSFDLLRVDRVHKGRAVITSDGDVTEPSDLVIDPAGATAYVAATAGGGGNGAVTAVDLLGSAAQTPIGQPGAFTAPQGIAWDLGGALLVADWPFVGMFQREGRIQRLAPAPGAAAEPVSAGGLLQFPQGLAVYAPEPGAGAAAAAACLAMAACRRRARPGARR